MRQDLRPVAPTPAAERLTADPEAPKHADTEGQEYFEVLYSPEDSMFLTGILEDILPVSKVIASERDDRWQYFSHRTPIRESKRTYSKAEVEADLAVLGELFGDKDRHMGGHNMQILEASPGRWKVSYHDFEHFKKFSTLPRTDEDWNEIAAIKAENLRAHFSPDEQEAFLSAFEERLALIENKISGPSGLECMERAVRAIPRLPPVLGFAERAPEDLVRSRLQEFQTALTTRIGVLRKAAESIRNIAVTY